ncbi:hypothetical protein [Cereibacter azotoformans]|uniref:Uncharacterized protein n=1 Tax=Cereibacter azotoformans TaxID=43057 RepID=A0A2T5JMJ8_9RHOB|nr:hypothetical protein [Cereibacter azotoformans]MBO4168854.1 hypothetical protein [Cereibacter azotoformans]PTR08165.1 hypothetical protein C8J28_13711 [Cereibacter azotoformans]
MSDEKNRPVQTFRDGNLKVAIWENTREDKTAYSVQFRRSYRDPDGQPREADTYYAGDLLRLSRLATQSYDRIGELRRADQSKMKPGRTSGHDQDRDR